MRRALLAGLVAGVMLGIATRLAYDLPREWWWLAKVGGPWLAAAFAVGWYMRRPAPGAVAGLATLVMATVTYYAIEGLIQNAYYHSPYGISWLYVAVPSGLAFGALGGLARDPRRRLPATATLAAAFGAEALLTLHRPDAGPGFLLISAALLPLLAARSWKTQVHAYAWVALLSLLTVSAAQVVLATTGYG